MKRKLLIAVLIGGVVAIPLTTRLGSASTVSEVDIEAAVPRELKASVLASGNLVYEEQAQLSPEVLGRVESIFVKAGDHVEPNQIVLRLDGKAYRAQVQQQQAAVQQQRIAIEQQQLSIANQEREYQRKNDLYAKNYVALSQFEDARYALNAARVELRARKEGLMQAEALLAQSTEQLAKTDIRAPMAGTVIAIDIKVGETAVPSTVGIAGSNLMTVANRRTIIAEINVDEADIARVKVGQEVSIHVSAYPDAALKGKVETLPLAPARTDPRQAQGAGSLGRNFSIKASVENPSALSLMPGMTCRAEIYTSSATRSLAVPIQAVLSNDRLAEPGAAVLANDKAEHYVFVDNGGVAAKRIVRTGLSDDSYQEIVNGLKENDRVIVGPYKLLRHLKPGVSIKVASVGGVK